MKEKDRNKEFLRFLKWIQENKILWDRICGGNKEEMTMEGFRNIMEMLHKEALYIPMYVLLTVYKDVDYVKLGTQEMFIKLLMKEWKQNNPEILSDFYRVLE